MGILCMSEWFLASLAVLPVFCRPVWQTAVLLDCQAWQELVLEYSCNWYPSVCCALWILGIPWHLRPTRSWHDIMELYYNLTCEWILCKLMKFLTFMHVHTIGNKKTLLQKTIQKEMMQASQNKKRLQKSASLRQKERRTDYTYCRCRNCRSR